MSTRCQIFVVDSDYGHPDPEDPCANIYRHSDGYPDGEPGVVHFLANFLPRFLKHRGWDPSYLGAQLMAAMISEARDHSRNLYQRMADKAKADNNDRDVTYYQERLAEVDNDFLGYGISTGIHGDIEYAYVISKEGVDVFQVDGSWEDGSRADPKNWKKLTTKKQAAEILKGKVPAKWRD